LLLAEDRDLMESDLTAVLPVRRPPIQLPLLKDIGGSNPLPEMRPFHDARTVLGRRQNTTNIQRPWNANDIESNKDKQFEL